jgi:hypothetical protein
MIVSPEYTSLARPERDVAPPMRLSVTIPIVVDGVSSHRSGFAVYVALSPFADVCYGQSEAIAAVAKAVHEKLSEGNRR